MGDHAHEPQIVTLGVELVSPGWKLKTTIGVPAGPTPLPQVLPLAHGLADAVTRMAEQAVEQQGEKITCRKGCAACCRTMVPISEIEARGLRALVDSLPEPRRTQIRERFADALRRLDQAGRLDKLRARTRWKDADHRENQTEYFRLAPDENTRSGSRDDRRPSSVCGRAACRAGRLDRGAAGHRRSARESACVSVRAGCRRAREARAPRFPKSVPSSGSTLHSLSGT